MLEKQIIETEEVVDPSGKVIKKETDIMQEERLEKQELEIYTEGAKKNVDADDISSPLKQKDI